MGRYRYSAATYSPQENDTFFMTHQCSSSLLTMCVLGPSMFGSSGQWHTVNDTSMFQLFAYEVCITPINIRQLGNRSSIGHSNVCSLLPWAVINMAASLSRTVSTSPSRIVSPLLSGIPWHTSAIIEDNDLTQCEGVDMFKVFRNWKQFFIVLMFLPGVFEFSLEIWITIIQFCWVYRADDGDAKGAGRWHRIHRKCSRISATESH